MAKDVVERVVETARAVEAGHAKDRAETTYLVQMDEGDGNWRDVARVSVPVGTHRSTVFGRVLDGRVDFELGEEERTSVRLTPVDRIWTEEIEAQVQPPKLGIV